MITPEQLAETMQDERAGQNFLPASNKRWEHLDSYDKGLLIQIASNVINHIEHPHKECKCEEYPNLRQLALDLKHVLDKYC